MQYQWTPWSEDFRRYDYNPEKAKYSMITKTERKLLSLEDRNRKPRKPRTMRPYRPVRKIVKMRLIEVLKGKGGYGGGRKLCVLYVL